MHTHRQSVNMKPRRIKTRVVKNIRMLTQNILLYGFVDSCVLDKGIRISMLLQNCLANSKIFHLLENDRIEIVNMVHIVLLTGVE